jgi:D-glycero-D-manno-heptose 1,7-bisphosphate phosphatase
LSRRGVFLDRDGVIVELVWDEVDGTFEAPSLGEDVRLVPGAAEAIGRIRALGYRTVVVSNQAAAAKGKASRADLVAAHERVVGLLSERGVLIDDYRYCLHHPDGVDPTLTGSCDCRKPKSGMLLEASGDLGIELSGSWMIGDSDADIEAGRNAGCRTILIDYPRSSHRRRRASHVDYRAADIGDAAAIIAQEVR